ncbi:hypothetical protein BGZ94_005768 [Podila epigama]|nr:hypothetical protein BGZ94_005768 [Podila epigama]
MDKAESTIRRRQTQASANVDTKTTSNGTNNSNDDSSRDTSNSLEPRVQDGHTVGGTGRLPRDAPFTPTYVNAYTANSAIAFVSLIFTATFFYFKINAGEERTMLTPICPSTGHQTPASPTHENNVPTGDGDVDIKECVLFGKIVILADSISKNGYSPATKGWVASLADEWNGRADVVLRSFPDLLHQESGSSSTSSKSAIKLVVMALGTDDAAFPNTRKHVPIDQYKENVRAIVSSIWFPDSPNYAPDTQVVLVTPAPVDDTTLEANFAAIGQPLDHANNITQLYAQACVEIGKELNVPVVDLWSDIMCQVDGSCDLHESSQLSHYLMEDGLHLRRMGNEVLYMGILNAVAHRYPQLHPICWPSVFPGYSDQSPEVTSLKRHCAH